MKLCTTLAWLLAGCSAAASPPARYDAARDELQPPADYRAWRYLSSGFQIGYGPAALAAAAGGVGSYDTVFVEPAAYAQFERTGAWPDGTLFVLEIRTGEHTGSIVTTGHYQTDLLGLEAEIKDARIPGGWGFFDLAAGGPAKRLPATAACYSCHATNAAVENTFTQFYPTLYPIAQAHGTVRKDFVGIPPSASEIHDLIVARGFAAARTALDAAVAKWPEATIAREVSLNGLGYRFLREHRADLAVDVLADVLRRFPDSANAYDSLGEAYEAAGKRDLAREVSERGLAKLEGIPAGPRRDAIATSLRERAARTRTP